MRKTSFLCCHKMIKVKLIIRNNFLFINPLENNGPEYNIHLSAIVCVNKRQIIITDRNTLSIHYKEGRKIYEIRLKCLSRIDVDDWIAKFRSFGISQYNFGIPEDEKADNYIRNNLKQNFELRYIIVKMVQYFNYYKIMKKRYVFDLIKHYQKTNQIYKEESEDLQIEFINVDIKSDKRSNRDIGENMPLVSKDSLTYKISFNNQLVIKF